MKHFFKFFTLLLVVLSLFSFSKKNTLSNATYDELVSLFKEWRTFENPPKLNGVPDYTKASFERRWSTFKSLEIKLINIDTTNWSIAEKADWHIVRAEMNGYDFNYKILKPWVRDPAFYKVLWMNRSDVPAHEGPTNHTTIEIWTYDFPLDKSSRTKLLKGLNDIPTFYEQAKENLTGNARDLWITGIRDIRNQSKNLKAIREWEYLKTYKKLVKAIDTAIEATNELVVWLEKEGKKKNGPSGIGKENYTWYLQNVHLVPMTWEDEVQLLERELARAWSALKLEEHRNRKLPELKAASNPKEFEEMTKKAADDLLQFLADEDIVTVKDYFKPALYEHLGTFVPEEKRNFFEIGRHYNPGPLYSHFYHWFELARMDNEPNKSEIRKGALLYNIFDSRSEGMATSVEEIFMNAGLYDDNPRVREIVYIMIAQRAARGLGSLYAHANEMTMEEAGGIHSEFTPRGWMKTEKELLIFEQHLYLRQPGYGTSYITGKYLMESAMADFAKMKETKNEKFRLKDFFDQLNSIGNIPMILGHWQMTGVNEHLNQIQD